MADSASSDESSTDAESTAESSASRSSASRGSGAFRRGGTLPTALCLTKAAIGAGVLSMAGHCAEVGLTYMLVCLVVGGALTLVSVRMIAVASIATGRWSFEDICEELFHPGMSFWTGFINVCNCFGSAAGYLIVCGQVFHVLSGCSEAWRKVFVALVGVLICGPLALARHVGFMRHLAALSVMAICLLVVTVTVFVAQHGVDDSVTSRTLWDGKGGATAVTYMNSINTVVFAYNNQFNVPQLTGELSPQPEIRRMTVVGGISSSICFLMYSAVSLSGVLAFGVANHQLDTLVLDLEPDKHTPLVIVTLLSIMFSVITCFQFHIYPIRQFFAYSFRKARGRSADKDETEDTLVWGISFTRWLDMACGLGAVLFAVLIAVAISRLKVILDFVGAFAGAWISFVVPPLFIIQVRRMDKAFSWFGAEVLACLAMFALGMFFFCFGTYSALVG